MGMSNQIPSSRLIQPGVIANASERPASPYEGQCIFQKDTDQLLVWNGSAWVIPNQTTTNPEGLELVKIQTVGTSVTSVPVNDVFSATYDNYLVQYNGGSCTANIEIGVQLGSTTTGYYSQFIYTSWNATINSDSTTNTNRFIYAGYASPNETNMHLTILSPYLDKWTRVIGSGGVAGTYVGWYQGMMPNNAQYTSFTISVSTGSLTGGTIRVYGYRK